MPANQRPDEKWWIRVGLGFGVSGLIRYRSGLVIIVRRTDPLGRTARFSIQVPLGNS